MRIGGKRREVKGLSKLRKAQNFFLCEIKYLFVLKAPPFPIAIFKLAVFNEGIDVDNVVVAVLRKVGVARGKARV